MALAIDVGVIASIVTGALAILNTPMLAVLRGLIGSADVIAGWADTAIVIAVIAIGYFIVARRGARATAGEAMLGTTYLLRRRRRRSAASPGHHGTRGAPEPVSSSEATATAARALGLLASPQRLGVLQVLLKGVGELCRGCLCRTQPGCRGNRQRKTPLVASPVLREPPARLLVHAAQPHSPQPGIGSRRVRPS